MTRSSALPSGSNGGELENRELRRLLRWQRRMIAAFVVFWILFLSVLAMEYFGDPPAWLSYLAFVVVLAFAVAAALLQFSVRCPRCGVRIGLQSRMIVPDRCRRCGVRLRPPRDAT
ncbi:MAG: hypothetical protein ACODAE_02745 [Gemmatimonadota bacterium]